MTSVQDGGKRTRVAGIEGIEQRSRLADPAFPQWPLYRRREFPDRQRLHRADVGKLLPFRYPGSRRRSHSILCERLRHLQVRAVRRALKFALSH